MKNKVFVFAGLIVIIISFGIIFILGTVKTTQKTLNKLPISTPTPLTSDNIKKTFQPQSFLTPLPSGNQELETNPGILYDPIQQEKMIQKIQNRSSLSRTDKDIKENIINTIPTGSEVVYKSDSFRVDYISVIDVFQVEILTTDLKNAKTNAMEWFQKKGLSPDGICNLPIMFYVNFDVANTLRGQNILFNPLPENC